MFPENSILKKYPELKNLNLPPEQLNARINAIAKIDDFLNNTSSYDMNVSLSKLSVTPEHELKKQMQDLQELLKKPYNANDWNKNIDTYLYEIKDKKVSYTTFMRTEMSKRMFLAKAIGASMASIILASPEKHEMLDKETLGHIQRFEKLILAIESHDKDADKSLLFKIHGYLNKGDLEQAKNKFAEYFHDRYKRDLAGSYESTEALANTFRKLGYYNDSANTYTQSVIDTRDPSKKSETVNSTEKQLYNNIDTALKDPNREKAKADTAYNEMLAVLPEGNTEKDKMRKDPDAYKEAIRRFLVYIKELRTFIQKNGDTQLSSALKSLNDMEGLNGFTNWSDQNVKMTKEIAIFIAATIATMGLSTVVSGVAAAARVAEVATLARAAKSSQTVSRAAAIAGGVGKGAEVTAAGINSVDRFMNAKKLGIVWAAGKFTVAESTFHSMFRSEGEKSGFDNFAKKFLTNTVMFGAIHGMEKIVTGPLAAKLFKGIRPEYPLIARAGDGLILSAGDIAVMQALHAAESGKMEWDWTMVFQALILRIGITMASEYFPKLSDKFKSISETKKAQAEQIKSGKNLGDQIAPAKEASEKIQSKEPQKQTKEQKSDVQGKQTPTKNPGDQVAPTIETKPNHFVFPEGTNKQVIEIDGHKWVYYERQDAWILNEKGYPIMKKPGELTPAKSVNLKQKNPIAPKKEASDTVQGKEAQKQGGETTVNTPREFTTQEFNEAFKQMKAAPDGTRSTLKIHTDEGYGYATYVKKEGNIWKHVESNISGEGSFMAPETLNGNIYMKQVGNEKVVQLSSGKSSDPRLKVESTKLEYPQQETSIRPKEPQKQITEAPANTSKYELMVLPAKETLAKTGLEPQKAIEALDQAKAGNKQAIEEYVKNPENWRKLENDAAAIGALFTLARLKGRTPSAPIPVVIDHMTQDQVIDACQRCTDGDKSTIDYNRASAASEKLILDEKRRVNLSRRWMKSSEWNYAIAQFAEMQVRLNGDNSGDLTEVTNELQALINNPTQEQVQLFQLCIGMVAEDNAQGQDGILGPNTTRQFMRFIEQTCYNNGISLDSSSHGQE